MSTKIKGAEYPLAMGEPAIKTDMFPNTPAYDLFPCTVDIQAIVSTHVETVVGLQRKDT